jgi:hypothetical protein
LAIIAVLGRSVYYLQSNVDPTVRSTFEDRQMCPPPSAPSTDPTVEHSESDDTEPAFPELASEPPIAPAPTVVSSSPEADRQGRSFRPGDLVRITQADVNCRAWMSTTAPIRSKLDKNVRASVLMDPIGFDGHNWVKVQLAGAETAGFVSDRYLTLCESAPDVATQAELPSEEALEPASSYHAGDALTTTARILLRTGPGKTTDVISVLGQSARGAVLGEPVTVESLDWVPVHFPAGSGWIAARFTKPFRQDGKWIEADLSTQSLHAWFETESIASSPISSGKPGFSTPPGSYTILQKIPIQRLRGRVRDETWNIPGVPWIMVFRGGGFYVHSVYWHDDFGTPVSHGCVTLPVDFAEWLYEWTPLGTRLWIHG